MPKIKKKNKIKQCTKIFIYRDLKLKGKSMKGKLPYAMDIVQAVPFYSRILRAYVSCFESKSWIGIKKEMKGSLSVT